MLAVARLFLCLLSLLGASFGAHAFLSVAYMLDRWELEQAPSELISKHNLAVDPSNVDAIRGMRVQGSLILRIESKSDCVETFCRTIVIRDCENLPCPHTTILAGPRFASADPAMSFIPNAFSMVFEGIGKKPVFVIVAPSSVMATTPF